LAFERLLFELSARFANLQSEEVEFEIQTAQGQIREFLQFERCTFGEFQDDGSLVVLSSDAAEGISPTPIGAFPVHLTWFLEKLRAGETITLQSLPADLPPEAKAESEYVRAANLRSVLSIPLRISGRVTGVISLVSFRRARQWPQELITRLKIVGEMFAQALARKREQEKLLVALAEIRNLKDRLERENAYLQQIVQVRLPHGLLSRSPSYKVVVDAIEQVAPTSSTVLLLGETGSGKEVLAQAIHDASGRKDRPMIKVNCAALPAALIESELFGREKGAFTGALARQAGRFELADGSTIFLDEVGELPLELQPKLLRVLQEGEFERLGGTKTIKVDARVIAATNKNLSQAVSEGKFRADLFYRLDVFPIDVPPLRERPEDIPLLTWTFMKEFSHSMGKPIGDIAEDSMAALLAYPWPGNVRELRNVIERAMILSRGPNLEVKVVQPPPRAQAMNSTSGTLENVERAHIIHMLEQCGWRIRGTSGAAALLEIKPTTLESRMKKLGIVQSL
jgi:transcriptional regulator with GAF, ATPase, and Fis domain